MCVTYTCHVWLLISLNSLNFTCRYKMTTSTVTATHQWREKLAVTSRTVNVHGWSYRCLRRDPQMTDACWKRTMERKIWSLSAWWKICLTKLTSRNVICSMRRRASRRFVDSYRHNPRDFRNNFSYFSRRKFIRGKSDNKTFLLWQIRIYY